MTEHKTKKSIQEWIIFALCLGLGAHVTLGFILHEERFWAPEADGVYGILISLSIYAVVQLIRSIWWLVRVPRSSDTSS